MQLTEFDWMLMNELLYKLMKAEESNILRSDCLHHLKLLLPFDRACFHVANSQGMLQHENPVGCNFSTTMLEQYGQFYAQEKYSSWIAMCTESHAYRISDYVTDSKWAAHPFFSQSEQTYGIRYIVRLTLLHNEQLVGMLSLFRSVGGQDFSDRDLFVLDSIKKHLALCLYRLLKQTNTPHSSRRLADLAVQYSLTQREQEILALLAAGECNEVIAHKLCIALSTGKKHILNIYKKLDISSRNDLQKLLQG